MIEDSVLLLPRSLLMSFTFKTANITLPIPFYPYLVVLLATPLFELLNPMSFAIPSDWLGELWQTPACISKLSRTVFLNLCETAVR